MKVMTYNVLHCLNYKTKVIDYDSISKIINEYNPDILGLNEIYEKYYEEEQIQEILKRTSFKYYYFAKTIDGPYGPYGNAVLSKIPFTKANKIMIDDPVYKLNPNGYYETRCIINIELENGYNILVTHFGLNIDEQENAVKKVLENLKDKKCILLGDLNVTPDDISIKRIKNILIDTGELLENAYTYSSDNPTSKIDYIFISKDLSFENTTIPKIIASDHFPYITTIKER